jgi:hypothetical protein
MEQAVEWSGTGATTPWPVPWAMQRRLGVYGLTLMTWTFVWVDIDDVDVCMYVAASGMQHCMPICTQFISFI